MGLLASIINYAVNILSMIIVLRVIISWLAPYTRNDFTEVIYAITEPMFVPFRRFFQWDTAELIYHLCLHTLHYI